ncbi:hypothetical protein F4679DRAFT_388731 [Xylaria curta]|nr:hypothetical protein F4679DRAFT_388731 [Xylaria curta]
MSDDVNKGAKMRGFALQCPWSNCFPQLYDHSREPCAITAFADFREMIDHIWKYHSFLLSCDKCLHRFKTSRRGEKVRQDLERQKSKHNDVFHSDKSNTISTNSRDFIKTMTEEQDKILKSWKVDKGKDKKTVIESSYKSLCSSLFGNGIGVPTNIRYNYYIAEHIINAESARLGKRNEEYFMQRRVAAQPGSTAGFHQQLNHNSYQHPKYRLSLDEGPPPSDWTLQKTTPDQDSGYGSKPPAEAALQASNGAYNNPELRYDSSQSNDNFEFAYGGETTYFEDALYRPSSVDLEMGDNDW